MVSEVKYNCSDGVVAKYWAFKMKSGYSSPYSDPKIRWDREEWTFFMAADDERRQKVYFYADEIDVQYDLNNSSWNPEMDVPFTEFRRVVLALALRSEGELSLGSSSGTLTRSGSEVVYQTHCGMYYKLEWDTLVQLIA